MKTLTFIETHVNEFFPKRYIIRIDGEDWYRDVDPPDWFFWIGLLQQYGPQEVEVIHEVIP